MKVHGLVDLRPSCTGLGVDATLGAVIRVHSHGFRVVVCCWAVGFRG